MLTNNDLNNLKALMMSDFKLPQTFSKDLKFVKQREVAHRADYETPPYPPNGACWFHQSITSWKVHVRLHDGVNPGAQLRFEWAFAPRCQPHIGGSVDVDYRMDSKHQWHLKGR